MEINWNEMNNEDRTEMKLSEIRQAVKEWSLEEVIHTLENYNVGLLIEIMAEEI